MSLGLQWVGKPAGYHWSYITAKTLDRKHLIDLVLKKGTALLQYLDLSQHGEPESLD